MAENSQQRSIAAENFWGRIGGKQRNFHPLIFFTLAFTSNVEKMENFSHSLEILFSTLFPISPNMCLKLFILLFAFACV